MTQQQLIAKIKNKVFEACPEITTRNTSVMIPAPFSGLINYRDDDMGIAEIMRTIRTQGHKLPITMSENGDILDAENDNVIWWDLEHDRIEDQSEETLSFIWDLIKDL